MLNMVLKKALVTPAQPRHGEMRLSPAGVFTSRRRMIMRFLNTM